MKIELVLCGALLLPVAGLAQPTPSHKCVYNCEGGSASPSTDGTPMGAAIGRMIFRAKPSGPPPDNGQSQSARQALDDWTNEGSAEARSNPAQSQAARQLDDWANEVRDEDLRDAPNDAQRKPRPRRPAPPPVQAKGPAPAAIQAASVPSECEASGEVGYKSGLVFYQCWPKGQPKYCLQTLPDGQLGPVPCNTQAR